MFGMCLLGGCWDLATSNTDIAVLVALLLLWRSSCKSS